LHLFVLNLRSQNQHPDHVQDHQIFRYSAADRHLFHRCQQQLFKGRQNDVRPGQHVQEKQQSQEPDKLRFAVWRQVETGKEGLCDPEQENGQTVLSLCPELFSSVK
jgi:hypothetical protein